MAELHKKFTDSQIKELPERYVRNEIERRYIQEVLGIKNRGFFILIKRYRENRKGFSLVLAQKYASIQQTEDVVCVKLKC